ncbi:Fic/DOC family protein [Aggregatibacter actinomycetemcomitans]|uniref:Fic/DOC family protein n=1 Tax=Aggregatibacter actinomycetemcomitans TaxID=714 RepID=UPI001E313BB3|nr:Fic family protein [Aggregatibacter actinomycetemcomitans]
MDPFKFIRESEVPPENNIVSFKGLTETEKWYAYFYKGTQVMKNLLSIRDAEKLEKVEKQISRVKAVSINKLNIEGDFDFNRLKSIHRFYFEELYSWAGEPRQVNMYKAGGVQNTFISYSNIEKGFNDLSTKIRATNNLGKFKDNPELMAMALCEVYLSINRIHAFREGNGRSQNEFVRQLAENNGYKLDLRASMEKIGRDQYYFWFQYFDKTGDSSLVLNNLFKANLEKLQINQIGERQSFSRQFKEANQVAKNKIAEQTASINKVQGEYRSIKQ